MMRVLIALFAGSGLLTVFCAAQMQYFALAFDHYFAAVAAGSALFGSGCGLALCSRRGTQAMTAVDGISGVQWIASSALAAAGALIVMIYLPLGPVYSFLLLVTAAAMPYLIWAYGCRLLAADASWVRTWGVVAVGVGIAAGMVASGIVLDLAGGPVRTGWLVCAMLCVVTLIVARRQTVLFMVVAAAVVLGLAATQINATRFSLPRWQPDSPYLPKPVLGALSAGSSLFNKPLQWGSLGRMDLLRSADSRGGFDWLMIDATAPIPQIPGDQSLPWLLERFPLVAIPLRAGNPGSLLSASLVPGPEIELAQHLPELAAGQAGEPGADAQAIPLGAAPEMTYFGHGLPNRLAGLRRVLLSDPKRYDLAFMSVTHPANAGLTGSTGGEAYLYTEEMLQTFWSKLDSGGLFAVTTRDELLFGRMLFALWDVLSQQGVGSGMDLVQQVWGMRLTPAAPYKGSYQFLLLAHKGATDKGYPARIREAVRQLPVEVMFGAGFPAVKPYNLLATSDSAAVAMDQFTKIYSRSIRKRVDFSVVTEQRPFFFHVIRDAHPYMKWLLTTCLLVLIPVLVLPLPALRQPGGRDGPVQPPLPVVLGYFCLLAGIVVMAAPAAMQLAALWPPAARVESLIPLLSILAGLVAGVAAAGRLSWNRAPPGGLYPLLMALLLVFICWFDGVSAAEWGRLAGMRLPVLALTCLLLGGSAGMAWQSGLRYLEVAGLQELSPWVWVVAALAMLSATILGYWLALLWGWDGLRDVLALAGLLLCGAGWWMGRWLAHPTVSWP